MFKHTRRSLFLICIIVCFYASGCVRPNVCLPNAIIGYVGTDAISQNDEIQMINESSGSIDLIAEWVVEGGTSTQSGSFIKVKPLPNSDKVVVTLRVSDCGKVIVATREIIVNTPIPTLTPIHTSTSPPSQTPSPTSSPNPTNTASPTNTATNTPIPTETSTATNTPLPPPILTPIAPIITHLELLPGGALTVEWVWDGTLGSNNNFAIRFWPIGDPTQKHSISWTKENSYQFNVDNSTFPKGDYYLNIAVMEGPPVGNHWAIVESEPILVNVPDIYIEPTLPPPP